MNAIRSLFVHEAPFRQQSLIQINNKAGTYIPKLKPCCRLDTASDLEVWNVARQDGYCLVSKDSDFNDLLEAKGFPPKVIWIRIGNCSTNTLFELLQTHYKTILDFDADESAGLLELQ